MSLFIRSLVCDKNYFHFRSFTGIAAPIARMTSVPPIATAKPTNQHFSVGPHGKECVDLTFVEEPLGLPAEGGYGWPQLNFSEAVGPDNRYVILRKLGWGMSSSTWLAHDRQGNSHVAIKVLNGYYTDLEKRGRVWELESLKRLSSPTSNAHCLRLFSNFTLPGKGSTGEHICLVTQLLGGDIKSLHEAQDAVFPLPLAKRILLHTLRGIGHSHSHGVVHTDLKHDNIFFDAQMTSEALDNILASDPPRRHPPEPSFDGFVEAAAMQPLPTPTIDEAMKRTYVLADFGSYIWTFGCLIFEFVTSRALFKYEPYAEYKLDEENNMLYQMLCYTCEDFPDHILNVSSQAVKFFDTSCNLKAGPPLIDYPFEISIRNYKVIPEADVLSTTNLMRKCLRLDPANRASASELLEDPWFAGID
ncbi:kinase-like domain-containing protein [Crucibulum laeve]|uniref:Kinase-like domain-containing protein n=1 Tax=Crucibulum laeve TaxID=68775 RepID=A0A5C3LKN7_9AGAR|nr:kinase-like domain-containing protein [Crucibulum laeve]